MSSSSASVNPGMARARSRTPRQPRQSREARNDDRVRNLITKLIDDGETPQTRRSSQVVRLGSVTLTNTRAEPNARGEMFEKIVGERNLDRTRYTLDPFIRGTTVDGKYLVATRASGAQIPVAKHFQTAQLKLPRKAKITFVTTGMNLQSICQSGKIIRDTVALAFSRATARTKPICTAHLTHCPLPRLRF